MELLKLFSNSFLTKLEQPIVWISAIALILYSIGFDTLGNITLLLGIFATEYVGLFASATVKFIKDLVE